MATYPRIKAIKIQTDIKPTVKPRIKAIKIQTDKVYSDVMYNGTIFAGSLK